MATDAAIGRRRALAVLRIEQRCAALGGGRTLNLTKSSRHGPDMLLMFQLEEIADYLETVEPPRVSPYQAMTAKQLSAALTERGLDKGNARSKSELTALLEAADDAATEEVGEHAQAF